MKYEILREKFQVVIFNRIKNSLARKSSDPQVLLIVAEVSELIEKEVMQIIFANMDVLCEDEEIRPWIAREKE